MGFPWGDHEAPSVAVATVGSGAYTCGSFPPSRVGGIGRHASLRSWWPQGCKGSSPLPGTVRPPRFVLCKSVRKTRVRSRVFRLLASGPSSPIRPVSASSTALRHQVGTKGTNCSVPPGWLARSSVTIGALWPRPLQPLGPGGIGSERTHSFYTGRKRTPAPRTRRCPTPLAAAGADGDRPWEGRAREQCT